MKKGKTKQDLNTDKVDQENSITDKAEQSQVSQSAANQKFEPELQANLPKFKTIQDLCNFCERKFPAISKVSNKISKLAKEDIAKLRADPGEMEYYQELFTGMLANDFDMLMERIQSIQIFQKEDEEQKVADGPPQQHDLEEQLALFTTIQELIEFYVTANPSNPKIEKTLKSLAEYDLDEVMDDEDEIEFQADRLKMDVTDVVKIINQMKGLLEKPRNQLIKGFSSMQAQPVNEDPDQKILEVFFRHTSFTLEQLRTKIQARDPVLRLHLLRYIQDNIDAMQTQVIWSQLSEYSNKHSIEDGYLEPASFTRLSGKSILVDTAIKLMFEGASHQEIAHKTKVELYLVEKLSSYLKLSRTNQLQAEFIQIQRSDAQEEIEKFLTLMKTFTDVKFEKINIKELRVIDFLKKENLMEQISECKTVGEVFVVVRPLIATYIQGALPLHEIYSVILKSCTKFSFRPTIQDLFDFTMLESEIDARAILLESYSQFYPVPIVLQTRTDEMPRLFLEIGYFIEPYKTILSFGLFRAHLMKCGKSTLIDEIFCTNFTYNFIGSRGSRMRTQSNNKFDLGRIDIQLPRNIDSLRPETKWSVLDAARFTDSRVLTAFCKHVNLICIHILANDLIELRDEQIAEELGRFIDLTKQVIIFVRDINNLTESEFDEYQTRATSLKEAFPNCQFLIIKSLVKETSQALEIRNPDLAHTYYSSLLVSTRFIKKILNTSIETSQMFSSDSLLKLDKQLNGDQLHPLNDDLLAVNQLIQTINSTLEKQIEEAMKKQGNQQASIGEELISNLVLSHSSCYYKIRKYHNQVSRLLEQKDANERSIEDQALLEQANLDITKMIDDRNLKINKWAKVLKEGHASEPHRAFLQFLNHERSVLLIWLLTQRLHRESKTNPIWRRLLLNQDLFLTGLRDLTNKEQPDINEIELLKLLDRNNPERSTDFKRIDSELSIFDFFRESIIQTTSLLNDIENKEESKNQKEEDHTELQLNGFKNYLVSGESLELVDGENMRIHDEELIFLMKQYIDHLGTEAGGKPINMYIVTQIGKQSVGKSFLLNQMFKTKFLNKSGRCTSGINFALRDIDIGRRDKLKLANNDKLLILDTEGLGSLNKGNRLAGKELQFDRVMVLFSLIVANALIITLKTEIDRETVEILKVCCWALSNIKIDKNAPPHIFFVLNQQADTNNENFMKDLNNCVEEILANEMVNGQNIDKYIKISTSNFIVLPNAFNQEPRNYSDIFSFPVQRLIMNHSFNEKCQDLGLKIIDTIKGSNQNMSTRYDQFMKIAGDSFRMITTFPDLLRFKNLDEIKTEMHLRKFVDEMLNKQKKIQDEYAEINATILKQVHSTDASKINAKVDYIDMVSLPLTERYENWVKEMRNEFDNFSKQEKFANFSEIIVVNRQILVNQLFKQYQDYFNLIVQAVFNQKNKHDRKEFKAVVLDKLAAINEQFMKSDETKWKTIFEKEYKQAEKEYSKSSEEKAEPFREVFDRMFKEHYRQFMLELKDDHRMTQTDIEKDYILPRHASIKIKKQTKTQYQAEVITSIVSILQKNIMDSFRGNYYQRHHSFITTNINVNPPGHLKDIIAKDQTESKYISLDCISETQTQKVTKYKYGGSFWNPGNWVNQNKVEIMTHQVPHSKIPKDVYPLVSWLITNKDDSSYTSRLNKNDQVKRLAQECPAKGKDFTTKIWDVFMQNLTQRLEKELADFLSQMGQGDAENNISHDRNLDTKCIRRVISIVDEMIQDVDYELRYIFCSTHSFARIYLNTLGFFIFLQKKTQQIQTMEEAAVAAENQQIHNFYLEYKETLDFNKKYVYSGLTPEQMCEKEIKNTQELAVKIINSFSAEVKALTMNTLLQTIHDFSNEHLSNQKLVSAINKQVKDIVGNEAEPEASTHDHLGVRYVINFHDCIESQFTSNWKQLFEIAFNKGQQTYLSEISNLIQCLTYFLTNLITALEKRVEYDPNLCQRKTRRGLHYSDFYQTDALFKPIVTGFFWKSANKNIDLFRIPVRYLKWLITHCLDPEAPENQALLTEIASFSLLEFDGKSFEISDKTTDPLPRFTNPQSSFGEFSQLPSGLVRKLEEADLFNDGNLKIFNLYNFITLLREEITNFKVEITRETFESMLSAFRADLLEKSKGCTERCPACNKLCEKQLNHQLLDGAHSLHSCSVFGHQFFSMGGRAWAKQSNSPILVQCHDKKLKDNTMINLLSGGKQEWSQFKQNNNTWLWDDIEVEEPDFGLEFVIKLYNKCGRQIFKFYNEQNPNVIINFKEFTESDRNSMFGMIAQKQVLFVMDGTGSMHTEIEKALGAILNFTNTPGHKEVGVVIYRSHIEEDILLEVFPPDFKFTTDMESVAMFLYSVNPSGGYWHESMLDGLAQAQKFNWSEPGVKDHIVIHIGDMISCQDWPTWEIHQPSSREDNYACCCCSKKCNYNWEADVFKPFVQHKLQYHLLFTGTSSSENYNPGFPICMMSKLGRELCEPARFQLSDKEVIDVKINEIVLMD